MSRAIWDKWCERGMAGLVLAILVYGPLATGAVHTPDFLVIQALTLGVILLWAARLWLNPRQPLFWPPICWPVVAFAIYAICRYWTADIEYVARLELVRVLIYTFLFLAILNNLYRQEFMQVIVVTMLFLAMAISFYAIYQFLTDSDKVWTYTKPYSHRGSGTYISPNNLAGFLELVLPLGLAWTLVSRAKPVMKVFAGYASFVILAGIAVTLSRGSWISTGLMLIVFFTVLFFHRTYRLPSFALLTVIVGAVLFVIPHTHFIEKRLKQLTTKDRINDGVRFDLWNPAVQLWRENLWWGVGPDHYNYRFPTYRPETVQRQPDRVHNDYLNTLTDWGIVGAALVGSAWVLLWAGVFKVWRKVRDSSNELASSKSNRSALVLGASMGLLAILFHSAVDFNMHVPANAILVITLMAMLSGCWRFATEKYWFSARVAVRSGVTLALLAGAIALGCQGTREATEYVRLERARRYEEGHPKFSPEKRLALEKAFAAEPNNFETAYAIGETLRMQSWEGSDDTDPLAAQAILWYERAIKLNPYHSSSFMREGMCLDWLGRPTEAFSFFNRAVQLDPNGYFTAAHMGWHYVQIQDYAAALEWFERSKRLQFEDNPIADSYLRIVNEKLLEGAANAEPLKPLAR